MGKNNLKHTRAMIGHKLGIHSKNISSVLGRGQKNKQSIKTVKKEKLEQNQKNPPKNNTKTLCDFVNPNTHRSFTLSAALITSLKESREFRKAQEESSGI